MNNTLENFIGSREMYDQIEIIGQKYNLHIDQVGELGSEVVLILQGESKGDDFVDHVAERLEIDKVMAEKIVMDVNENIILPIKRKIREDGSETTHPLETPEEILKHIEDGGLELPAPEKTVEIEVKAPQQAPTENKTPAPEATPAKKTSYTVDPYREPLY